MNRKILQLISALALVSTLLPSILFLTGTLNLAQVKTTMLVATLVWFLSTPCWMGKPSEISHEEVIP